MELGYISAASLDPFQSLLLPEAAAAIAQGEPVTALGITEGGVACGALAGAVEGGVFLISSLYVAPDHRRKGGGQQLLQTLAVLLEHMLFTGEEQVIFAIKAGFTTTAQEHEVLSKFLLTQDFLPVNEGDHNIYLTTLGEVSPALTGKQSAEVQPFSTLPESVLSLAGKKVLLAGAPLPQQGLNSPALEREVSVALLKDGQITAFAAFDFSCAGHLTLAAVWADEAGPGAALPLLRGAMSRATASYPPETVLAVQTINEASARLVQMLLPKARPISSTYIRPLAL